MLLIIIGEENFPLHQASHRFFLSGSSQKGVQIYKQGSQHTQKSSVSNAFSFTVHTN